MAKEEPKSYGIPSNRPSHPDGWENKDRRSEQFPEFDPELAKKHAEAYKARQSKK
jgi:hypothetical protein